MAGVVKPFPWVMTSVLMVGVVLGALSRVEVSGLDWDTLRGETMGAGGLVFSDLESGASADGLRGELVLKDPTPLFLPTSWNSGQVEAAMAAESSPGTSFGSIDAKLVFLDRANNLEFPKAVVVPESAQAAMDRVSQPIGHGELTRRDRATVPLASRRGYLEILAADTGKLIYSSVLSDLVIDQALTAPVEAVLAVSGAGLWVRPTVLETPDGAAVDFDQINLALKAEHLDAVLSPGIYRILLGP